MIAGPVRRLIGTAEFSCASSVLPAVLDALMREEIPYDGLRRSEDGTGFFRVSSLDRRRVEIVCAPCGGVCLCKTRGLPYLLHRYRRRFGIPLGIGLFCLLIYLSSHVIWSMDVSGNETVSDTQILSGLDRLGCGIGSYIPSLDLWQISNRYLLDDPDLVFLSVNLEGTHAHVRVMERTERDHDASDGEEGAGMPSNLVAARDGQIVRWEVTSGQAAVQVHDVVREGELLVSGVVNTKVHPDQTFRLERAVGKVYAQTHRKIEATVPLADTQTLRGEGEVIEKTLIFFRFRQKLFKKGGKVPLKYDIITEKTQWVLFRNSAAFQPIPLPIWLVSSVRVPMTEREVLLDVDEARERAMQLLWETCDGELRDKELLRYEITDGVTEDGLAYRAVMELDCIEDIAREVPIGLSELSAAP